MKGKIVKNLKSPISKISAASLVLAVAAATLFAVFSAPASSQSGTTVPGAGACSNGTYVHSSVVPVDGPNNDLIDDCVNLIAIQNHWGGRTLVWGAPASLKINDWDHVKLTGGRVSELDIPFRNLGGSIPSEIGNLTALTTLRIDGNKLTGQIPSSLCNLSKLNRLDVDDNSLTGSLPSCFGNLSGLVRLYMDGNSFTGGIPASYGNQKTLLI